jgi:hypothetical protein
MLRDENYRTRNPIAERAYSSLAFEREWDALDRARIGGHTTQCDLSDLQMMSDREIVNVYLDREEQQAAYADERR